MNTALSQTESGKRTLLAHALLLGVVFVWGTTFPLVKAALRDISPLLFNLLRMTLAAVVLLAINYKALRGITRRQLALSSAVGALLALGYQAQTAGLARTTPIHSAFLTGLVVVLVPLLSMIPGVAQRGSARPGAFALLSAGIAFIGVVLLTAPTAPRAGTAVSFLFSGFHFGEWLTVGCALAFAAHLLAVARSAQELTARRLGTLQIAFAAAFMLLTLPLDRPLFFRPTPTVAGALAVTSLLATAAAFTIQSWAQERLPASHVALIFTLEPLFAWLTSLVLGERLSALSLLGAALILAAILLAELRPTSGGPAPVSLEGSTL